MQRLFTLRQYLLPWTDLLSTPFTLPPCPLPPCPLPSKTLSPLPLPLKILPPCPCPLFPAPYHPAPCQTSPFFFSTTSSFFSLPSFPSTYVCLSFPFTSIPLKQLSHTPGYVKHPFLPISTSPSMHAP